MSTHGRSALRVEPITDAAAFRALEPDWNRLLKATPDGTPLQSFDFLWTWWQSMSGDRRLWVLALRDGAQLEGLAPLQIAERRILGRRYRVVEFLGMTEDILRPTFLFPTPRAPELRAALVDYLVERRADWDLIELDELAVEDPIVEVLRELSRRCRLIHRERPFHDCPYIDLSGKTATEFFAERSRKLLKNLRAMERKLRETGEVTVDAYTGAEGATAGFAEFAAVERRSWKRQAVIGMAADAAYELFYAKLLERFGQQNGVRVLILKLDGRPIAGTIGIMLDGVYCSLQIAHDDEYSRFSPGTLLERYELERLLAEGSVRRYEPLGGALTNKLRWTSNVRRTLYVRAWSRGARTTLLDGYEFWAKPTVKRWLRRFRVYPPDRSRVPA